MFKIITRHNINLSIKEFSAIWKSILKGRIFKGSRIEEFEKRFAAYTGVKHAVSISSGRMGLHLIFKILNIKKGDEIIVPSYAFFTIPALLKLNGIIPVFTKIDKNTYNIDVQKIQKKINKNTKAVILIHTFGQPCEMDAIMKIAKKNNLYVIEDCGQACGSLYHGEKTGSIGHAGLFSFAFGKNMTCLGGGMITTNNTDLAEKLMSFRSEFDFKQKKTIIKNIIIGIINYFLSLRIVYQLFLFPFLYIMNVVKCGLVFKMFSEKEVMPPDVINQKIYSLSNIQAVIGIEQLKKLEAINKKRIDNAERLNKHLANNNKIFISSTIKNIKHTYNCYVVKVPDAELFYQRLFIKGIDSRRDYMTSYSKEDYKATNLYLPNHPKLKKKEMEYICKSILKIKL